MLMKLGLAEVEALFGEQEAAIRGKGKKTLLSSSSGHLSVWSAGTSQDTESFKKLARERQGIC